VHGEQRHLDGERDGEAEEQPVLRVVVDADVGGDLDEVEGERDIEVLRVQHRGGDQRDEHERRPEHRVQEELQRGIRAVAVTPLADEEVHRHEHDLEEDEEQEQVEREEHTQTPGFEHEQPRVIGLVVVVRIGSEDGDREEQPGEHDEEQRDAVDAQRPADAELGDPAVVVDELEALVGRVERHEHRHGERAGEHGHQGGHHLVEAGTAARKQGHEGGADERRDDHRRQQRCVRGGCRDFHQPPAFVRKRPTRMNAPTAMPSA
jgi:hypothetical protein